MAPVERTESYLEEVSSRCDSTSDSTSPVSSSTNSTDGSQQEATVCECQQEQGRCVCLLVRLQTHQTLGEVQVVRGYIQKAEKKFVDVYSRFGFGRVARSAILGQWDVNTTEEDLERLKTKSFVGIASLQDLSVMTELFAGSILLQPADRTPSSSYGSSTSPSSNYSQPSRRYHRQQGNKTSQPHVRPAQSAQQQMQHPYEPLFQDPSSAPVVPQLNPVQGFMLPVLQPNPVPVSTTMNYVLVPFHVNFPIDYSAQNGTFLNQNVTYVYPPVVHQATGYYGQQ